LSDDLTDILGAALEPHDPAGSIEPGVVCVGVIPYVMTNYYTVRPLSPDPKAADHQRYRLVRKTPGGLAKDGQDGWSFPFKDMNLDSDEDFVLFKVKRRPVVVLSMAVVDEHRVDPTRFHDSFWCAPSYTMIDRFGHPQWPQNLIEGVLALTYRSCFPVPCHPSLHDRLSVLRLDRLHPIPRHCLDPTDRRFTGEWTFYLQEWVRFYLTGRLGDDDTENNPDSIASVLKAARDLFMSELAKARSASAVPPP